MSAVRRYAWWLMLFVGFLSGTAVGYAGLIEPELRDLGGLERRERSMLQDLTKRYARAVQLPVRQRHYEDAHAALQSLLPFVDGIDATAAGVHAREAWQAADGPALKRLELTSTADHDVYVSYRFLVEFSASYRDTVAAFERLASAGPVLVPARITIEPGTGGVDVVAEFEYLTLPSERGSTGGKRR
ncbi:MAG: hypothetical protein AAF458_02120 [Pseudomonadota bacterium]